jgi:hypothetical protein
MSLMLCQNEKMDIQLIFLLFMVIVERSSYAKTIHKLYHDIKFDSYHEMLMYKLHTINVCAV